MNNQIDVNNTSPNALAHLGDAVYELYIRRKVLLQTQRIDKMHSITTAMVNCQFHADLLNHIRPQLTEQEESIVRRARNQSLSSGKRKDHVVHRLSTSLEALIGYLYMTDMDRLEQIFNHIDSFVEPALQQLIK